MQEDQNLKILYAQQFKKLLKDSLTSRKNVMLVDSKALTTLCGELFDLKAEPSACCINNRKTIRRAFLVA